VNQTADPVVSTLTGRFPFLLIMAALMTWPVAMGLLGFYTRSVRRSMRSRALSLPSSAGGALPSLPVVNGNRSPSVPHPGDLSSPNAGAESLFKDLRARPWHVAAVYSVAGLAYALVTNASLFMATNLEFLPIRFTILLVIFMWPVVITVGIVAAATRAGKGVIATCYFIVLALLASLVMSRSPDLTWGQIALLWALYNLPSTILFLTYLARPVRAVGPMVLTVMFAALAGSDAALVFAASSESRLRLVVSVAMAAGLGGTASFVALLVIGFAAFALFGWIALGWIRRRYQAKLISDESVTVDSVWLLFTVSHSVGLVFEHVAWVLAWVAAFAAYKATARIGFSRLRRQSRSRGRTPRLLLLRSFSIGKKSERLFDALEKHWRRVGSIQLIAGVDLARRSVEPHEFLDFMSGKLARRFIDGPEALDRRLSEIDTEPDRDLRFRVNDFFCYDDTWRMVLSRLVRETDAVLMDLRGFSRQNSGCIFEIRELVATVPLERVVFVIDETTERGLLSQTLQEARVHQQNAVRPESEPRPRVFELQSMHWRELRRLLLALAMAVEPSPFRA
jgi:hypothetical protein